MKNRKNSNTCIKAELLVVAVLLVCIFLTHCRKAETEDSLKRNRTNVETLESTEHTICCTESIVENRRVATTLESKSEAEETTAETETKEELEKEPETETETQECELEYLGNYILTFYCPCTKCCGKNTKGITRSGTKVTEGRTVAVDRNVIPLGTHLLLVWPDGSEHEYIAEDTGSGVNGKHIDIYLETHERALQRGVEHAYVYIVRRDDAEN